MVLSTISLQSCVPHHHKQKVHVYTTSNNETVIDNDFIYWYIIESDNGQSSYSYSSTTPVTNFSNISWTSNSVPKDAKVMEEQEIPEEQLPEAIENEMNANSTPEGEETTDSNSEGDGNSSSGSDSDSGGGD